MAPFHHPDRLQEGQASSSTHLEQEETLLRSGKGAGRGGRGASNVSRGIPGSIPSGSISKLKAQRRQTERLLKRDDLTPDVRITSERRLKTLLLELEKAELSSLEKIMVTRYRGIKFFERQKVLRKIKGAKKALLASPNDPTHLTTLFDSRIDLYYILQYPKTQKYIALFPEGTYISHSPIPSSTDLKEAAVIRSNLRENFKRRITIGELEMEAEGGDLDIEGEEQVENGNGNTEGGKEEDVEDGNEEEEGEGEEKSKKRDRDAEEEQEAAKEVERKVKKVKKTVPVVVPQVVKSIPIPVVEQSTVKVVEKPTLVSKPVSKPEPKIVEAPVPAPTPATITPVESTESEEKKSANQSKKEKKDRKDALRKAKKEGTIIEEILPVVVAPSTPAVAEKVVVGRKAKKELKRAAAAVIPVIEEKAAVVESWAAEDDFFS